MANERLGSLRKRMKEEGIDAYYIPSSDYHDSEYVEDFFQCMQYVSGFTGNDGTLVVTDDFCGLWTDGRYFIQAAAELPGQETELMKMGEPDVPTIEEFFVSEIPEGGVLGFDGRVVNAEEGRQFEKLLAPKGITLKTDVDLVGDIWKGRPVLEAPKCWVLPLEYAGESFGDKAARLRDAMRKAGATVHVLSSLDDIAWLTNLRKVGRESIVAPAHMIITDDSIRLFIDSSSFTPEVAEYLDSNGVEVCDYGKIYDAVSELSGEKILVEPWKVSLLLMRTIPEDNIVIEAMNPTTMMKAAKIPAEQENMRKANLRDGVALTKFIFWMKDHAGDGLMETEADKRLEEFRKEQWGYICPSFDTISAYGPNAAMPHYHADGVKTDAKILPEGLYLIDSGGEYPDGTTDVTRTIAVGPVTDEEKLHCTLVLKAMLALANSKFLYGCRGANLDYAAREPIWKYGLDYNHGTGHGVGYVSNCHERPNNFRWRIVNLETANCVLEEGMVTSDEPGIYIEGSHGVRTENLLLCKKAEKNEYGQFMEFETLTFAPIDLETIDISLLEPHEIKELNDYHAEVFEKLSPYFEGEELERLRDATRAV